MIKKIDDYITKKSTNPNWLATFIFCWCVVLFSIGLFVLKMLQIISSKYSETTMIVSCISIILIFCWCFIRFCIVGPTTQEQKVENED